MPLIRKFSSTLGKLRPGFDAEAIKVGVSAAVASSKGCRRLPLPWKAVGKLEVDGTGDGDQDRKSA